MIDTHEMNADPAKEAIAELVDPVAVRATLDHERRHPKYEGGRQTVIDAAEARLADIGAVPPEDDSDLPYRISTWLGHKSYHCRQCPFGTLDRAEVERHTAAH